MPTPPNTGPNQTPQAASPSGVRDWHVLEGVCQRLEATGEFDEVHRPDLPEMQGVGTGSSKIAVVSLLDWDDGDDSDEADSAQDTIRVRFALTLIVRHEDPAERDAELDRLLNAAKKAINYRPLVERDGEPATIPAWTKLRRGKWEKPAPPERRMSVVGESAYLIDGEHDTEE